MQTYTHLFVGLFVGKVIFPHEPYAQAACAAGSIIPDLVMVPKFALDKIRGKEPMAEQSNTLMVVKEMSHSLPMWTAIGFLTLIMNGTTAQCIVAFSLGGILHIIADIFSHRDEQYRKYDLTCVWPLNLRPISLTLYGFAPWEYRKANGDLTPKIGEGIILIIFIIAYLVSWIR